MINHSPEAIAAYPDGSTVRHDKTLDLRTHDAALVAATHARQYAATREALKALIYEGNWADDWLVAAEEIADALLATPGPLLDAGDVRRDTANLINDRIDRMRAGGEVWSLGQVQQIITNEFGDR